MSPEEWEELSAKFAEGGAWGSMGKALLRDKAARKRLHEAQVAGDADAIKEARSECQEAEAEVYAVKDRYASSLLLVLRWCNELFPGLLVEAVRRDRDTVEPKPAGQPAQPKRSA